MTRISSLLLASAFAILPLTAFAQPTDAPAKTVEPTGVTTTSPNNAGATTAKAGTTPTAAVSQSTKPDMKGVAPSAKAEMHGVNGTHKGKVPTKTPEPSRS